MMKTKRETLLTGGKHGQRSYLGRLAKKGFQRLSSAGAIDEPEDAWRAREAEKACGHRISEAPRRCFTDLETHFLALAGETKRAFDRATGPSNDVRTVAHEISVAAATLGVGENYIKGMCRRMFQAETWEGPKQGQAVLIALLKAIGRKRDLKTA